MTYEEEQFKQSRMYTPLYVKQEANLYPNRPPDGAKQPQQRTRSKMLTVQSVILPDS